MRRKFEAFDKFKQFKAKAELQLGKHIKALRSNRGGEYLLGEFKEYLTQHGTHGHGSWRDQSKNDDPMDSEVGRRWALELIRFRTISSVRIMSQGKDDQKVILWKGIKVK